jgi:HAE1 family hydrophobic/amphiphilic exporter-1
MAVAIIGGLVTSTVLTLGVVPVVYSLVDDLRGWVMRKVFGTHRAPALEVVSESAGPEKPAANE